jgi:hypothetical protein
VDGAQSELVSWSHTLMPSSFELYRYFIDHGVKAAKKKERQLRPFRGCHKPDHKLTEGIRQHGCLYATVLDNQVVYLEGEPT